MTTFYRVHRADESTDTVLDPRRPDGWVASGESYETQPYGVSCCDSIEDLLSYIVHYTLTPRNEDLVLMLEGSVCDRDADLGATRVVVESYRVIGEASGIVEAAQHKTAVEDLRCLRNGWLRSTGCTWGTFYESVEELREELDISDAAWAWLVRAAEG